MKLNISKSGAKSFLANVGVRFVTNMLNNPEKFEKYLKGYLNDVVKKSDPSQFEYDFEHDVKWVSRIDPSHVEKIHNFIVEYNLDTQELLSKIRTYLPKYNTEWVMSWLYDEHPEFYDTIVLHPNKKSFEKWMALQIQEIGEYILNYLN